MTTPRSEPENREGEEDYPSLCPQCGQAAKDSRFCPYCGHDKIEEESFGSLLQERQEALKRERLHNERWGRSVLGLFLFHGLSLVHAQGVFFPYSEILLGLLLAYTGIIFSMVESSFRYYLLKKAEKPFLLAFPLGILFGLLHFFLASTFKPLLTLPSSWWNLSYALGAFALFAPLFCFGCLLPTLEQLGYSQKQSQYRSLLTFTTCGFWLSWLGAPLFFLLGFLFYALRQKSRSLHPLLYLSSAYTLTLFLATFLWVY